MFDSPRSVAALEMRQIQDLVVVRFVPGVNGDLTSFLGVPETAFQTSVFINYLKYLANKLEF